LYFQTRRLLAVSLYSGQGWELAPDDVAGQPSSWPREGSDDEEVYQNPGSNLLQRRRGLYMTRVTDNSVAEWAFHHDFHVINGRMVCNDDGEFAGFAPIWIDPVRHAVVVDVLEFMKMFKVKQRFVERACEFFANACSGVKRFERVFANLVWGLEDELQD
jgi:hypothetical protein